MYKIERKSYGIKLTFSGYIDTDEMKEWKSESVKLLKFNSKVFHVFIDMRNLKSFLGDAKNCLKNGMKLYKNKGMSRSVVILNNILTALKFKRIAQENGMDKWEKYIDSSNEKEWELKGLSWLKNGIDPDKTKFSCITV